MIVNKIRKIIWNILSIVGMLGYFYALIKKDIHSSQFMLLLSLVSNNIVDIIELKEKNDIKDIFK